jgi:hypothetical protein
MSNGSPFRGGHCSPSLPDPLLIAHCSPPASLDLGGGGCWFVGLSDRLAAGSWWRIHEPVSPLRSQPMRLSARLAVSLWGGGLSAYPVYEAWGLPAYSVYEAFRGRFFKTPAFVLLQLLIC